MLDKDVLKKAVPYIIALLVVFIIDLIVGKVKNESTEVLEILIIASILFFIYASIMFYLVLKYQKEEHDNFPKIKEITKVSTITTTILSIFIFIYFYITCKSHMCFFSINYFLIYVFIGAVIGLFVGLVFSTNASLKTNPKIVFTTIIFFFILPSLDLIVINQGIEELSWISMFGFLIGTFIAILFRKGAFPKKGPITGLLIASIPMIIDFMGLDDFLGNYKIRIIIGYKLWILYLLPIIGLVVGYYLEKSLRKNQP